MKILLSILATVFAIVLIVINMPSDDSSIDDEVIGRIILPYMSQRDDKATILFSENIDDEREGINILTIIALSKTPYVINKGNALTVNSQTALDVIKVDLPNYNLGRSVNETATSYRWQEKEQWGVTVVETSNGFYSRWQRIANKN